MRYIGKWNIRSKNDKAETHYRYDALGRRIEKSKQHIQAGRSQYTETTQYGWDGDTLAYESTNLYTKHYVYEKGSFVPLIQATYRQQINQHQTPQWEHGYDYDKDPLWHTEPDLLISDDDQESLFKPKTTAFEVTTSTPIEEENANLEKYQKSRMPAVLKSEAEEVKIYSDINTEAFLATRFDTVIDWLDLKFTVDPKKCDFWLDPKARSFIKAFITRQTGTRHYVADRCCTQSYSATA